MEQQIFIYFWQLLNQTYLIYQTHLLFHSVQTNKQIISDKNHIGKWLEMTKYIFKNHEWIDGD